MTLSLADIDRWDPQAVNAVFAAAIARANGTRIASAAIGQTMTFLDWDGRTAEAARAAAGRTMADLDSHADACEAVGRAARTAAEEITGIKSRLARIRTTAGIYHLSIDNETGAVGLPEDLSSFSAADQREIRDAQPRVAAAIGRLSSDAEVADEDLAAAILGAGEDASPRSEVISADGSPESDLPFPFGPTDDGNLPVGALPFPLVSLAPSPAGDTVRRGPIPPELVDDAATTGNVLVATEHGLKKYAEAVTDHGRHWTAAAAATNARQVRRLQNAAARFGAVGTVLAIGAEGNEVRLGHESLPAGTAKIAAGWAATEAGAASGAELGLLVGGPPGAFVGGVLGGLGGAFVGGRLMENGFPWPKR